MTGRVTTLVMLLSGLLIAQAASGAPMMGPKPIVVQGGFQTPESVLYDPRADMYLVSNINGNPTGTDNNGFISRVSPAGKVMTLKWIEGGKSGATLNAPKGMAVSGTTLYVSDITAVRMFDRATGRPKGSIEIQGSTFINDLAAGADAVYASDSGLKPDFSPSGADAIYRISGGQATAVAKGAELNHPNGIAALADGRILVVTFTEKGEVYTLSPDGKRQEVRTLPAGQLDGVELLPGGAYLVSSWAASAVYRVDRAGMAKAVVEKVKAPADIGYDGKRSRVLIPLFMDNRVVIHSVK